jgi:hypothetical protein
LRISWLIVGIYLKYTSFRYFFIEYNSLRIQESVVRIQNKVFYSVY